MDNTSPSLVSLENRVLDVDQIPDGALISVVVRRTPRNAAKRKTLVRLLNMDMAAKLENRKQKKIRAKHFNPQRRGGRLYGGQIPKIPVFQGIPDEWAKVRVTSEVKRMLPKILGDVNVLLNGKISLTQFRKSAQLVGRVPIRKMHGKTEGSLQGHHGRLRKSKGRKDVPRFKLKFPEEKLVKGFVALESPTSIPVVNMRRHFVSVQLPKALQGKKAAEADFLSLLRNAEKQMGAKLTEDYRFAIDTNQEIDDPRFQPAGDIEEVHDGFGMDEVFERIRLGNSHSITKGENAIIAIIDTGINGNRPEFPSARRFGEWAPNNELAWTDLHGHGTMVAAIAAGSGQGQGEILGVAPRAQIISCRTSYYETELTSIYDFLCDKLGELTQNGDNRAIIANNSWGFKTGTPPGPNDTDIDEALGDAIKAGVIVVFSAGNNHWSVPDPAECQPTSIWRFKTRSDVLAVGAAITQEDRIWDYSSRGPGQDYVVTDPKMGFKPDVVGSTPRNGRMLYGNSIRPFPIGWGTSGCAPQASGLAALLLSQDPSLSRSALFDRIRQYARDLGICSEAQGAGILDISAALAGP